MDFENLKKLLKAKPESNFTPIENKSNEETIEDVISKKIEQEEEIDESYKRLGFIRPDLERAEIRAPTIQEELLDYNSPTNKRAREMVLGMMGGIGLAGKLANVFPRLKAAQAIFDRQAYNVGMKPSAELVNKILKNANIDPNEVRKLLKINALNKLK